jgi:hypothetical protein
MHEPEHTAPPLGDGPPAMDTTIRRALGAVAGELQSTMASLPGWAAAEGAAGARPADLQRALCNALGAQLGAVASVEGPLPEGVKQHWAGWLGRADVLARTDAGEESYFETQLCGVEKLHEALWDALKLALFSALDASRCAYLMYAAPESAWARAGHHPEAIFAGGSLGVYELLRERDPELWEWCLRGTKTTRPQLLPAALQSTPIASASIRAPTLDWELRCVRIDAEGGEWVGFDEDGWPTPVEEPVPGADSEQEQLEAHEPLTP